VEGCGQYDYYSGVLDEVRISNVARASNWVWACYMNMASNGVFNIYGSPEYKGAPTISNTNGATNVTLTVPASRFAHLDRRLRHGVFAYWGPSDGGTNAWANTNTWAARRRRAASRRM